MNNNQLFKKATGKHEMVKLSELTSIEYAIESGGYLDAIATDNFKDFMEDRPGPLKYAQAVRYRRLSKHKAEARILERDEGITTIDALVKRLPKYNEPPRMVEQDPGTLAYVGTVPAAVARDNWHTPAYCTDLAREVMGSIDLDPFSSVKANQSVQAGHFYTVTDDAFTRLWRTDKDEPYPNLWMNPPYSKGASATAVVKFLTEWQSGSFTQAIVLMNASTDVKWYRQMWESASGFCHTYGRIAFEDDEGKKSSGNTRGQVFFYFGPNVEQFKAVFRQIGIVDLPGGG